MKRYYLSLQLVGLLASLPLAYEDTLQWDITVRDFEPDHADFENFDERTDSIAIHPLSELSSTYSRTSGAYQCYGERFATYNPTAGADTSYWSCEDGYACSAEHPQAYYGAYTFPTIDATVDAVDGDVDSMATSYTCHRHEALAYAQAAAAAGVGSGAIKKTVWEERVFVTRGMVANQLCMSTTQDGCSGYTSIDADDPYTWIPRPLHPTMGCHSDNFDQWFQDNSEFNKTINTTMSLILVDASTGLYTINSKTMPGQAYFPLDTVTSVPTWGKQTLKFWCPPYDGGWNETGSKLSNLCEDLLTVYGGPRSLISAGNAANYYGADSLLHNYFFTIAGITSFKYHSGDTFIFSGDDDMWVFVDGYLVADLGGTHNPAEARLVMSDIAKDLISRGDTMGIDASNSSTWRDTSAHYLHFFYADRQSDGSNLRITTTISDTRIPRNGSPKIDHAEIDGDTLYLYVNTALSEATLSAMNSSPYSVGSSSNYFPIIGTKWKSSITANDVGDLDTTTYLDTLGLTVSSIFYSGMNDGWYVYGVVADYCDTVTCDVMTSKVSSGDSLSFNFYSDVDAHTFALLESQTEITSASTNTATSDWYFGPVTGSSLSQPVVDVDVDTSIVRPPFTASNIYNGGTSAEGTSYSGIGGAEGDEISKENTGEVILSLYPDGVQDTADTTLPDGFGNPVEVSSSTGQAHTVDTSGTNGYYEYVYTGGTTTNISKCEVVVDGVTERDNCLNFGFNVDQPFRVNVMIYDHLGHFVSQYQASVDSATIASLQQKQSVTGVTCPTTDAANPYQTAIENGNIRASIQIYPISNTGRKIATGVYILKVDMIQEQYTYYQSSSCTKGENSFFRSFDQYKMGYMRSSN